MKTDVESIDGLRARFRGFCDSLLRSICIQYSPNGERRVRVELFARDWNECSHESWREVSLQLDGVGDYCFCDEENKSMSVLSNGAHVVSLDGLWCIELGYSVSPPQTIDEARQSTTFAVAQRLSWLVADSNDH